MSPTITVYDTKPIHVFVHHITHLDSDNNYSIIHRINGKTILTSRTLKRWEDELSFFVRVHKNCLVNPQYIDLEHLPSRKDPTLRLLTGQMLVVSRRRLSVITAVLEQP